MKLIYSHKAAKALNDIYKFLNKKNSHAAVIIHNEILDEIDRLLLFPQIGPIEPELENISFTYRSLVVRYTYKVIYRIEKQTIYIVDIWDCRCNPLKLQKGISE